MNVVVEIDSLNAVRMMGPEVGMWEECLESEDNFPAVEALRSN